MTPDITRLTLGELISDPDTVVQRHAHGIVKRLRSRQGVDVEAPEHSDSFPVCCNNCYKAGHCNNHGCECHKREGNSLTD